jgi:hypothetical protein
LSAETTLPLSFKPPSQNAATNPAKPGDLKFPSPRQKNINNADSTTYISVNVMGR